MKREREASDRPADRGEDLSRDLRFIGGLVARIQDQTPPDALLAGVMAGIEPKKPSAGRRFWRLLTRPQYVRFTPMGLVYGVVLLAVVLAGWSWVGLPRFSPSQEPSLAPISAGTENYRFTLSLAKGESTQAKSVAVIGDFNNWTPQGYEMIWDEDCHCYNLSLPLPRGRYQYAFLVDGRILADPRALLTQEDGFGHKNSIVIINHDQSREKNI